MVGTGSKAQERARSTRYVLHTAAGRVGVSANAADARAIKEVLKVRVRMLTQVGRRCQGNIAEAR